MAPPSTNDQSSVLRVAEMTTPPMSDQNGEPMSNKEIPDILIMSAKNVPYRYRSDAAQDCLKELMRTLIIATPTRSEISAPGTLHEIRSILCGI